MILGNLWATFSADVYALTTGSRVILLFLHFQEPHDPAAQLALKAKRVELIERIRLSVALASEAEKSAVMASFASAREPDASDTIGRNRHRPKARSRWDTAVAGKSRPFSRCGSRSQFSIPEISVYRPPRPCAPSHAHQAQTSFSLPSSAP